MPLKSRAQEKALWSKSPAVAQEYEDATTPAERKSLPEHVRDVARKERARRAKKGGGK